MNWLERDAQTVRHPFTQHSSLIGNQPTVTGGAEGQQPYDVDGNRVLYGVSRRVATVPAGTRTATVPAGTPAADDAKGPSLPPPDPDQPSGPSPTDPEGPTDPKPTEPTDPTGPDEPPALAQSRLRTAVVG
jgi:hypothetical protein